MATDPKFWNSLLDEISDSMFKELPRDRELNQAEWQELYDQLRLLSGRYRTSFPSAHPCRYYREGQKIFRELELTRWKDKDYSYKLTEDQRVDSHNTFQGIQAPLDQLDRTRIVKFSDAPSSSWKLPRFHEMVQMIWRDCVILAEAPVILDARADRDKLEKFAALLAVWAKGVDEGKKYNALESLHGFLQRQGLPDSPLVHLDQVKQDTRSSLKGSTLQSVSGTGSISSGKSSWTARTKEKLQGFLSGDSAPSMSTASTFERVTSERSGT